MLKKKPTFSSASSSYPRLLNSENSSCGFLFVTKLCVFLRALEITLDSQRGHSELVQITIYILGVLTVKQIIREVSIDRPLLRRSDISINETNYLFSLVL